MAKPIVAPKRDDLGNPLTPEQISAYMKHVRSLRTKNSSAQARKAFQDAHRDGKAGHPPFRIYKLLAPLHTETGIYHGVEEVAWGDAGYLPAGALIRGIRTKRADTGRFLATLLESSLDGGKTWCLEKTAGLPSTIQKEKVEPEPVLPDATT